MPGMCNIRYFTLPPPPPPLRVLSHYLSIYLSIYPYTHIDSYKKKFVYAQTLSLFTPQTLHPDILRKQRPQTWHHVFLPNIRPGRGGRRAAFKISLGFGRFWWSFLTVVHVRASKIRTVFLSGSCGECCAAVTEALMIRVVGFWGSSG